MIFLIGPLFSFIYVVFSAYFCYKFAKLSRSDNHIAPYILGVGTCSVITFLLQGLTPLLFPTNSWPLTFFANFLFFLVGYTAMAFFAALNSYTILPAIKPVYFFTAAFSIGIIAILSNIIDLQMTTVNAYGMVDRHFSAISFIMLNFLLLISFFPPCLGLIYHSVKNKQLTIKGVMFAIGAFLFPFFVGLSFSAQTLPTFIFLNVMCILGWILMMISFTAFDKK